MSVIDLPYRAKRPSLVRSEPARVVKHPSVEHDFSLEFTDEQRLADEAREAIRAADVAMAALQQNLDLLLLKAEALAKMHGREEQVAIMFDAANSKLNKTLRTA